MVGVAVRVDEMCNTVGSPPLQRRDNRLAGVHSRRVEADHTVATVERDTVTEALDDRQVVGQLAELVGDPVDRLVDDARVDDS